MSKTKGSIEEDELELENDDEFSIKEGANDLMNLPIETLRKELKKRNFHPGVVDRMEKWFLASMLREAVTEKTSSFRAYNSLTKRVHGGSAVAPIFSHEDTNDNEEDKNENETKEEAKEPDFDPNEFLNEDEFPPSSFIQQSKAPIAQIPLQTKRINLVKDNDNNPWAKPLSITFGNASLDKYVPIDVLESLPDDTQKQIQQEIKNGTDFDEIIAKYLIPDIHP